MSATKKCNKCYATKEMEKFYKHPNTKDKRINTCILCMTAARKHRWFEIFKYKGSKCCQCGISDLHHPEIYEFHHIDPELKEGPVSSMVSSASDKTLYAEVDKCMLVCANCHNIEHKRIKDKEEEQDA